MDSILIVEDHDHALDEGGKPSFNLLQGFGNTSAIVLYAFDLLMLRGKDVRRVSTTAAKSFAAFSDCYLTRARSVIRNPSTCRFRTWYER